MPMAQDYYNYVHSKADQTGTDIGHSGDEYTEDELDTEITYPGLANKDGLGLHMLVHEVFDGLTSVHVSIVHGSATEPTTALIGRTILLADLAAGKHFYIPFPAGATVLRYIRGYFDLAGSNPTTGEVSMWFGPPDGSENA